MGRYLITLWTLDSYFFGGAMTFGDGQNLNYLVKSEKLPQQTTILGMLRKEILKQHGPYRENINDYTNEEKEQMDQRIGTLPFSVNGSNDFGAIKNISPVFITDGNRHYIPVPLDFGMTFNKERGSYGSNGMNKDKMFVPTFREYIAKQGLSRGFLADDGKTRIEDDEDKNNSIFQAVEKVGIRKSPTGGTEEEAYYKQTRYKLNENYRFAVIVECDLGLENALVEMGGERSTFEMTPTLFNKSFVETFQNVRSKNGGVLLLGDTFAPPNIYDLCDFAITDTIVFQHFSEYSKSLKRSAIYHLLKRGSALFGDATNIEQALTKPRLTKVGFNIIKSN